MSLVDGPAWEKENPPQPKESSVEATLAERGSRYGDFSDHAVICQRLQDTMRNFYPGSSPDAAWDKLSAVHKQALTVIADKIARILSGDPNYADNWHDIQGYAKLVEDRLPKSFPCDIDRVIASKGLDTGMNGASHCKHGVRTGGRCQYCAGVCSHGIPANEGCRTCAGEF